MLTKKRRKAPCAQWITQEQANSLIEAHARQVVGVGRDEFKRNWKAGKYANLDSDDCPGIVELAIFAGVSRHHASQNASRSRR
jgi:hypothetical protein